MLARVGKIRFNTHDHCLLTIPDAMAEALALKRGDTVLMVEQDGALLIERFHPERDALRLAEVKGMGARLIRAGRPRKCVDGPCLPFTVESAA